MGSKACTCKVHRSTTPTRSSALPKGGLIKGQEGDVMAVRFTPDGKQLVTSGDYNSINVFHTDTWDRAQKIDFSYIERKGGRRSRVFVIEMSTDGIYMAVGMGSGEIYIFANLNDDPTPRESKVPAEWKPKPKWKLLTELREHTQKITCLSFYPDGKKLLSGSSDASAILWDIDHQIPVRKVKPNLQAVNTCAISSKGLIAIGTMSSATSRPSKNVALSFWNMKLKCQRREWLITYTSDDRGHPTSVIYHDVTAVTFSPEGDILVACLSCAVWFFETRGFQRIKKIELMGCNIPSCVFSSTGKYLVFVTTRLDIGWCWDLGENKDKRLARPTVWIYCGKDFTPLDFYHGHSRMIMDCCVTHDETTIATASKNLYIVDKENDSNIRVWDLAPAARFG
ncbi:hypothetical protein AAMO2058_000916200 [Amorphochlora amoebiformis]